MAMRIKKEEKEWTQDQVEKYAFVFPQYKRYSYLLKEILEKALKKDLPLCIVQTRPKSLASFAEKILRKREKYYDPVRQLTDLCGARVITHTPQEVRAVCEFLEKNFDIDWENSVNVSQRLKPTEFGYRSVHYVVQFRPNVFPNQDIDVEIPEDLYPKEGFPMKAEIQVMTFLEYSWAVFSHERSYKGEFVMPDKWKRELAALAALLESADNALERIHYGLQRYASSYSSYMSEKEISDKIEELEAVLKYDPQNIQLAHQIGKLAIELGDWEKAISMLSKHRDSGFKPLLRDLGIALCKLHQGKPKSPNYGQGQKYLLMAAAPPSQDVDAICSLAGTWKGSDEKKAEELYRQAFMIDPTHPYPLGNYLEYEIIRRKDISIVNLIKPVVEEAILRCRDQIEVGMNLPWAFYDAGKFNLLLGRSYESLSDYSKAIELSADDWMIETSLKSIKKIQVTKEKLPEIEWIQKLIFLGLAMKFQSGKAIQQLKKMATKDSKPIKGQVVIVAGGFDIDQERKLQTKSFCQFLEEAFMDFEGTVISGGITASIGSLVGKIQEAYPDSIQTIGYVPKLIPTDLSIEKRYREIRRTRGKSFTACEPLQYWIDLISSGFQPSQIKLVGINGGPIAAIEYRIALGLGMDVAVIEQAGGEAAKLVLNDSWKDSPTLFCLPLDAMTLREFIGFGALKPSWEIREIVARSIHENYLRIQSESTKAQEPSLAEWEKLSENLRESNRQQADHISKKLQRIGCSIHKVTVRDIVPIKFSKDEIETMAEMEHGRWNVERIRDGWKWGEKKDVATKISPYLVSWSELPEAVREWDRETVQKIPDFLAKVGLEVRRK